MKKFKTNPGMGSLSSYACKILIKMKLTLFLLLACTMSLLADDTYSQSKKLNLHLQGATIKEALTRIEDQSEFYFMYSGRVIDVEREVSVNIEDQKINNVLDQLFAGTDVNYTISDRIIVLTTPEIFRTGSRFSLQQHSVTGTVTDPEGTPLPGVNIVEVGTTNGAVTDLDGNYSITVSSEDAVLSFSFVGYLTEQIEVGGQTNINVTLVEDIQALDEVVVIGYGTMRKSDLTGAVSSVEKEQLADMISTDASEVLKGNVSGVTVTESHTPGAAAKVRIRGLGTINNNDPLWVVDGVPGGEVNPNNIESISVLKDASAQAIYGARASNGVILVTTKSGRKGQKMQVNVNVKYGVSQNISSFDLLNTQEYGEMLWLMAKNAGLEDYGHTLYGSGNEPDIPEYILPARAESVDYSLYDREMLHEDGDDTFIITKANRGGTDWLSEIVRPAGYQEYAIDVTGGSENASYSFMGNYLREEGIAKYTGYQRYNLRSNVTFSPTDWFEIGQRIGLTYSEDWGNQADNNEWSIMSMSYRMQPIIPVRDIMGNFAGTRVPSTGNGQNPLFQLWSNQYDQYKTFTTNGNAYAKAELADGLSMKSLFGFVYSSNDNRNPDYNEKARSNRGEYNSLSESSSYSYRWNWSNTIEYDKNFGEIHDINILGGTEAINNNNRWRGASRVDYYSREPNYMQLDVGALNQANYGNTSEWSLFSFFGRVNYELVDKYLIGATFRRDGSSRFGNKNNYGNFPAFSAGWRLSEENFMAFSEKWLDYFKIRGGWGKTGNDQIGNYNSYSTYVLDPSDSFYPINGINTGNPAKGFRKESIGNPDVKWETTTTINLGLDATFLKNLYLRLDFWKRETDGMLYTKRIPDVVRGRASLPSINIGNMNNKGVDMELSYRGYALNKELQYDVSFNISHYQNEVEKLSGAENEFIQAGSTLGGLTRTESGRAFPEFYGYIVEGIFQTEDEANAHAPAFGENGTYNRAGNFKFKDVNEDGVINSEDQTYIGSPHPDFTSGLNLMIQYKGFSIKTRFYSSYGNEMLNHTRDFIDFNKDFKSNRSYRRLYQSWGSPYLDDNKNAKMPIALFDDKGSRQSSTYFMEDASYLRMQSLQMSYNFAELMSYMGIGNLRLYAQITNLFTITNYSGLDPEVNSRGMNNGIDAGAWPTPRQYLLGVNIDF